MAKLFFRLIQRQYARLKILHTIMLDVLVRGDGFKRPCLILFQTFRDKGAAGVRQKIRSAVFQRTRIFSYNDWIRKFDTIDDSIRIKLQKKIKKMKKRPLISIVMPVFNPPVELLEKAINSVQSQIYPDWELCIADDFSTDLEVRHLLERYSLEDGRIKVIYREENGHISEASNTALEIVSGEFIALLDHDDELPEHALFWVVEAVNKYPDIQMLYSDEDKIDLNGERYDPYFKSDWNHDLFLSQNMFSHLGVYKFELVRLTGGFKKGLEGSQDYDLALRCYEHIQPSQIYHIPKILYHWRALEGSTALSADEKPYAIIAGESAINHYLGRKNISAKAESTNFGYRVKYQIPLPHPMVSLIIPTRNGVEILRKCIDSILAKTLYENYEIIVIDNGSDERETLEYLDLIKANNKVRVIRDESPFNYSALNNKAAKYANGSILGLINNDVEVITPDWMGEMVSQVSRAEIGIVGARLLYPDKTLQHGGIILGLDGVAGHSHKHIDSGDPGYFCRMKLQHLCAAVTGACLFIRKSVFEEVGGLNEIDLTIAFNDVDFCLRVIERGYHNLWTPYAELYHHESKTRGAEDTYEKKQRFNREIDYMKGRWSKQLQNDPYYNPNLSLHGSGFTIAFTPRIRHIV